MPSEPRKVDPLLADTQADAYSQALMKVQPDGTIQYDFDGHIHAEGLDLDYWQIPSAEPQAAHAVKWTQEGQAFIPNVSPFSWIYAEDRSVTKTVMLALESYFKLLPGSKTDIKLQVASAISDNLAFLNLHSEIGFQSLTTLFAGAVKTIIDSKGESNFLFSPTTGRSASGTVGVTWAGASPISNTVAVAHGLGANPTLTLCSFTGNPAGGWGVGAWAFDLPDPATIHFRAQVMNPAVIPPNGSAGSISWLAFTP